VGMVNDHTIDCFRYERVGQTAGRALSKERLEPSAAGAINSRRG
jgi:hypothetical protein